MKRGLKIIWRSIAALLVLTIAGVFFLITNYELHKTDCAYLSDRKKLDLLRLAHAQSIARSRPQDVENLCLVPTLHHRSIYTRDDPDYSVYVDLVESGTGKKKWEKHLFADCDIETWGGGENSTHPADEM
ncbi:hypothetical protein [Novosphingobium sp.]|uniref:hypothetical protein n=1 Tax=Novosphingobium sp. TaxID=1874826 RepID=UPI002602D044|nr:hypothetical protein [Novosphingobium sp.]